MDLPDPTAFTSRFHDPVWAKIATDILRRHRIEFDELTRAAQGENIVFLVDDRLVLKIYTPFKAGHERELAGLEFAAGATTIRIPEIVERGDLFGYRYLLTTRLDGHATTRADWLKLNRRTQCSLVRQLAEELKQLHSADAASFEFDWPMFLHEQVSTAVDKQRKEGGNPEWIDAMPSYFEQHLPLIPATPLEVFQHGDVHFGNLRLGRVNGKLRFTGLFDFADSIKGFREYEFIAVGVLMIQGQGDRQREFFRAYGYRDDEIDDELRNRMFLLTMLYEYSSLRRYAERLGVDPQDYTLEQLGRAIWSFC